MGKFTAGPDWIDVEMTMRALDALHGGKTRLIVSPEGIGSSGGLRVLAEMEFAVLPGSDLPKVISAGKRWPCGSCRDLPAHCWNGLIQLDYLISQAYEQKELPM